MSITTNVMQCGELLFIPLDRPFPTSPWECLLSRFVLLFAVSIGCCIVCKDNTL